MKNLTVDGQGSDFVFYGFVNPFVVEDSSNITFKNFTVDVARPFHSEGIIESFEKDGFIVKIPENFPYRVREGVLEFTDGRPVNKVQTTVSKEVVYEYGGLLEFDTKKRETAYMARDYWTTGSLSPRIWAIGELRFLITALKELWETRLCLLAGTAIILLSRFTRIFL
ncbi:MAG: hypothetical protein ACLUKN_04740 [Bacilli bacterium]